MGNTDGNHTWITCGSHMGNWRGKTYGSHVENCCTLQRAPLVAAHVWPMGGTHVGPLWGQYNFAIWEVTPVWGDFMFSIRFHHRLCLRRHRKDFCLSCEKLFTPHLRYMGQRKFRSEDMHWMTFP